jgi:heat shock protein HtpX
MRGLWNLKLSMVGTLSAIIALSTLGFAFILGTVGGLNVGSLVVTVAIFNLGQWLLGPYLVNMVYRVREIEPGSHPDLEYMITELSKKSRIKVPKLMLSGLSIPNAFAYGSPLTGNHVAVTKGLLDELDAEQVQSVVAHELGHIKHGDVQVMMLVSFLPSLFYILSRSFLFRGYGRKDRDNSSLALIGGLSLLLYLVLTLFNLSLSRLREYYADQHSVSIIPNGGIKLSEALAKISTRTYMTQRYSGAKQGSSSFKTLFISDPDKAATNTIEIQNMWGKKDNNLVNEIISKRITGMERFMELFSTHPNIVKRLRALNYIS